MMDATTLIVITGALALVVALTRAGQVSRKRAAELLAGGARILDVRTPGEYESGHVEAAENLPLDQVADRIGDVVPDLDTALLLHCLSGARSGSAVRTLKKMGYTNVHNLGSLLKARQVAASNR